MRQIPPSVLYDVGKKVLTAVKWVQWYTSLEMVCLGALSDILVLSSTKLHMTPTPLLSFIEAAAAVGCSSLRNLFSLFFPSSCSSAPRVTF